MMVQYLVLIMALFLVMLFFSCHKWYKFSILSFPFLGREECIKRAEKVHCKNRIAHRQVKCEINFIPLVYSVNDGKRKQLLHCHGSLSTRQFARCGKRDDQNELSPPCSGNSAHRCSIGNRPKSQDFCFHTTCDHAVLVSGGWNPDTNHPRYRQNLHQMWKLLRSEMHYKPEKIVTFFGQGQKSEREYRRFVCTSLRKFIVRQQIITAALLFDRNWKGTNSFGSRQSDLLKLFSECSLNRFIIEDHSLRIFLMRFTISASKFLVFTSWWNYVRSICYPTL